MQSNMLNDLAKAMKALDGKKIHLPTSFPKQIPAPSRFKFIIFLNNGID